MTSKEKAKELAHDYFRRGQLGLCSPDTESAGYECAMKMAEWKERQMIDKACEWLKVNLITVVTDDYTYTASVHNISREEFIEQFKKAMEE